LYGSNQTGVWKKRRTCKGDIYMEVNIFGFFKGVCEVAVVWELSVGKLWS
jgi:hypothetical protein